jgi:chemotaxis protein CheZ
MNRMSQDFLEKLHELRITKDHNLSGYNLPEIIKVFNEIYKAYVTDKEHVNLFEDITKISTKLEKLYNDINDIKPYKVVQKDIPNSLKELTEVMGSTEESTNIILDSAEQLMNLSGGIENHEMQQQVMSISTKIMESCNFQDLTSQRITKVTSRLYAIEKLMQSLLKNLDIPKNEEDLKFENEFNEMQKKKGKHLMSGPQTKDVAPDQKAIDDLFDSI